MADPLALFLLDFIAATGGRAYGPNTTDTDCVRATLATLERRYGAFTLRNEQDVLISHGDLSRPWSPLDGVEADVPGCERVDAPLPGRVHLFQGWRVLNDGHIPSPPVKGPNGHAGFLYADADRDLLGFVTIINANVAPRVWVEHPTWEDFEARYTAGVRLLVLP